MQETCLNGHNRTMRKFVAMAAIALIAGCGGGGSDGSKTSAKPNVTSNGGVVTAEGTKGILGPAVIVVDGKENKVGRTGPISPKENRPTDAQRNGVAGSGACASTSPNPAPSNLSAMASAVLCLLNIERTSRGLAALHNNAQLHKSAQPWANRMV